MRKAPTPLEIEQSDRCLDTLHLAAPQVAEFEESFDELGRVLGQTDVPALGECLHALREAYCVTLRRVIHTQVVADLAHHDLARVQSDAQAEGHAVLGAHLTRVLAHRVTHVQRGVAGALCVVLVRDRSTE